MTAADEYRARIDAVEAQVARLSAHRPRPPDAWAASASAAPVNVQHPLTPVLERLAAYLRPDDVLLDIGGGVGRMSLPLASRCREVVNIEPSPGMGKAFLAAASQAALRNARWVAQDWLAADGVQGDVALVCHVTYYVRDVVPFLEKLQRTVRRRVLILVGSTAPFAGLAHHYPRLFGEELELRPTFRELLPVLWELGILPDVHILPSAWIAPPPASTREAAIAEVLRGGLALRADLLGDDRLHAVLEAAFDAFFIQTDQGFQRRTTVPASSVLITWEAGERR